MTAMLCPYCGKDFATHGGTVCAVLGAAMVEQIRAVVQLLQDERDAKAERLALSSAITPRRYPLTNAAGQSQMLLPYNLNRGIALVYNDDAADVMLGEDRQHIEDPTKQFPLKTKVALAFTSPNELHAIGTAAGPQNVFVLELPGGRQSAEYAGLFKLA